MSAHAGGAPVVRDGDTVIFETADKKLFVTVRPNAKVKLGAAWLPLAPLVGRPFGTLYTPSADGRRLEPAAAEPLAWDAPEDATRDNRDLPAAGAAAQALAHADIEALKAGAPGGVAGGRALVDALAAGSATFGSKSEYAQEKYRAKKERKYVALAAARRPAAAAIAEAYGSYAPGKVGHLRADALGLALSLANAGAGARLLVIEACGGLVAGAAAERLGGVGAVTWAWLGPRPPAGGAAEALGRFNLAPAERAALAQPPLAALLAQVERPAQAEQQQQGAAGQQANGVAPAAAADSAAAADPAAADADPAAAPDPAPETAAEAAEAPPAAHAPPFSGLIVAAPPVAPAALLRRVLPLLAPSAPFAVWAQHAGPLAEALAALRAEGLAVGLALHEQWWREYQVLPRRTHPAVGMSHTGGYVLAGTAVGAPAPRPARAAKRQREG